MQLLNGKEIAEKIREELKEKVDKIAQKSSSLPHLAAILVGNDPASDTYVNSKIRSCKKVGIKSTLIRLPENVSEEELLKNIDSCNRDEDIDGFIVQLPLPDHIDENKAILAIDPKKDVDGFHPENLGKLVIDLPTFISATPLGILELLKRYQIPTDGKHCVVMGRSNIVGKPVSILMSSRQINCTVTITHSHTKGLKEITQSADILIVAIGKPRFVKEYMVKQGAVVIDVGMHRLSDSSKKKGYRLVGDVDFDDVAPKCSAITPVPKGVGPMTVTGLLMNTLQAFENKYV